jgi:hypothetical protein
MKPSLSLVAVSVVVALGGTVLFASACTKAEAAATACPEYCANFETQCADVLPQYIGTSKDARISTCTAMCGIFKGKSSPVGGNLLACRESSLDALKEAPATAGELRRQLCLNAGPYSGLPMPGVGTAVCGASSCESYCNINAEICTGNVAATYAEGAGASACRQACILGERDGAFKNAARAVDFDNRMTGDAVLRGNNFLCRAYHTQAAILRSDVHCVHTNSPRSSVCNDDQATGDAGTGDAGTVDSGAVDAGGADDTSDASRVLP